MDGSYSTESPTKKRRKIADVDRISNLPDSMLIHILSFLSIKEAVQTSLQVKSFPNLCAADPARFKFDAWAADPASFKFECMKDEIAKMTEKGRLIDTEAVNKLVSSIQMDRTERKLDLAARVMLADVIAATNRDECLDRFVQLKGVPVLDDWLQEAQKAGKQSGDSGSPKEGDSGNKLIEDLLLALLRALDKLPVNLNVLRTCSIGKSVNHMRNHKNFEIQRKARKLVDTWKERVDAEMKHELLLGRNGLMLR